MYNLLDPYGRHKGIGNYGLEALVATELCVFALFAVFELMRAICSVGWVKAISCTSRCLEGNGEGVRRKEVVESGDEKQKVQVERRLVTAMKRIDELEASRAFIMMENRQPSKGLGGAWNLECKGNVDTAFMILI